MSGIRILPVYGWDMTLALNSMSIELKTSSKNIRVTVTSITVNRVNHFLNNLRFIFILVNELSM